MLLFSKFIDWISVSPVGHGDNHQTPFASPCRSADNSISTQEPPGLESSEAGDVHSTLFSSIVSLNKDAGTVASSSIGSLDISHEQELVLYVPKQTIYPERIHPLLVFYSTLLTFSALSASTNSSTSPMTPTPYSPKLDSSTPTTPSRVIARSSPR